MKTYPFKMFLAALVLHAGWGCRNADVIHAERKDLIETVYASGKITPENEYSLSAQCTGTIEQKFVKDGDTVRKGQLLYLVSNEDERERADAAVQNYAIMEGNLSKESPQLTDLALSLQNAMIRVRNDSLTYYRWKALWAENIGTRNNLDNCYSNYLVSLNERKMAEQKYLSTLNDLRVSRNNALTQAAAARKDLKDYSIRSDRDGVVYQTFKETGESVRSNEVVALLGEQCRPLIRLAVDQQDIDKVRLGQTVLVQADATGTIVYEATVSQIYPVMNESDQTFRVDAHFTGATAPAFIHSSVEANIIVQKKANILVLPRSALAAKDSVRVYDNGKDKKVRVQTGITTLDDVEIVSGLTERTAVWTGTKNEKP